MPIPFTQYLRPDGRKRAEVIDMPPDIEALADQFMASGGWYECEVLGTGHVSLTACMNRPDGDNDIAIELCANGPPVVEAVEKLVRKSVNHIIEKGATQ